MCIRARARKSEWETHTTREGHVKEDEGRKGAKGRGYEEEEYRDRNEGTRKGLTERRERERRR